MRVKEWVEKSRAEILPYSEKEPRFGTLQEELKEWAYPLCSSDHNI
jgi:hypothetical protein